MDVGDRYRFARTITGTGTERFAAAPPLRQVRRLVIDRPEALPSEFLRKLEDIINQDPRAQKIQIPGTRAVTTEK